MENSPLPQEVTPKRNDGLWRYMKYILRAFFVVVFFTVLVNIVQATGYFVRHFPESGVAAWFSDYATSITTRTRVNLVTKTRDSGAGENGGDFLVVRSFDQQREARGGRAFLSTGTPYTLVKKFDVLLLRHDGSIVWERNFVEGADARYPYQDKYIATDQKATNGDALPAVFRFEYLDSKRDVRLCSADTLQVALLQKHFNSAAPETQLRMPGVTVNLRDGTFQTFTDPSYLCDAPEQPVVETSNTYRCDATVDFAYEAGVRKVVDADGALGGYPVEKVYWQFPCWGHYENGVLDTRGLSVQPTVNDSTQLIW